MSWKIDIVKPKEFECFFVRNRDFTFFGLICTSTKYLDASFLKEEEGINQMPGFWAAPGLVFKYCKFKTLEDAKVAQKKVIYYYTRIYLKNLDNLEEVK